MSNFSSNRLNNNFQFVEVSRKEPEKKNAPIPKAGFCRNLQAIQ